jgi:hypothetical protein
MSVNGAVPPMTAYPQTSRDVRRGVDDLEQPVLRWSSAGMPTPTVRGRTRGRAQAIDVSLEFGAGEAAAAADVDRPELASLHEGIDCRPTESEHLCGLLGGEQ